MEQPSLTPDILFVPPITDPSLRDSSANFIPVGILVLLSCLKESSIHGAIFKPQDPLYFEKSYTDTAKKILSHNPKIVGFSTWCHSYPAALLLAKHIKRIDPAITIIFGGPQASVIDRATLTLFSCVDYILRGEAENTIGHLVKAILSPAKDGFELIHGLTYRDPNNRKNILVNSPGKVVKSMDELPIPAYQEIGEQDGYKIDVGRGCPFKCTYCTTNQFFSKSYRVKSPDRIIDEMQRCYELSGSNTTLGFAHDMFTLNKRFVKELCKKLKNLKEHRKEEFKWTCSARTDCVSKELLKLMVDSGCQAIFFGIESGSAEIQKRIQKNLDLDQAHDIIEFSISIGIDTIVSYMAGFPFESKTDLEKTLRSILQVLMFGARPQITLLSVLPGTPIYSEYMNQLEYDGSISGFSGANLSETEGRLIRKHPEIFSSFYYLPNQEISRDLLIFLTDLVNQLPDFIPSVRLIQKFILKDIYKINLLDYIENRLPEYDSDPSGSPALSFIMDSFVSYLSSLADRGLPDHVWEVFRMDCMKAFLRTKRFRVRQFQSFEETQNPSKKQLSREKGEIQLSEFVEIISTKYDISAIYSRLTNGSEISNLRWGDYRFAVVARSFKSSSVYKLNKFETQLIEEIESMNGIFMSELEESFTSDQQIGKVIERFRKRGLLKIT